MKLSDSRTISTGSSPQGWVLLSVQQLHLRSLICQTPVVWEPHHSHLGGWEIDHLVTLWRKNNLELKTLKTAECHLPPSACRTLSGHRTSAPSSGKLSRGCTPCISWVHPLLCHHHQVCSCYCQGQEQCIIRSAEMVTTPGPAHLQDPEACSQTRGHDPPGPKIHAIRNVSSHLELTTTVHHFYFIIKNSYSLYSSTNTPRQIHDSWFWSWEVTMSVQLCALDLKTCSWTFYCVSLLIHTRSKYLFDPLNLTWR